MRQSYHSLLRWSLLTGTSTILLKLCCDSIFNVGLRTSTKSFSTYEEALISWAWTGQNPKKSQNKPLDTKLRDDLQLIGAQIYFRHGARTPLSLLQGLEEVSYSKEHIETYPPTKWDVKLITKIDNTIVSEDKVSSAKDIIGHRLKELKTNSDLKILTGQLTAIGEKQLFELGQSIRPVIIESDQHRLLPDIYDPNLVYCRSTYMDRTIASARSFLAGLFSSKNHGNQIQAKVNGQGPFEIEVHHFPDEDMFPNFKVAPALNKCHTAIELYRLLNDSHDLKRAREALLNYIGDKDYPHGLLELHDEFVSREAHNFSIPSKFLELTKDFEIMTAREFVSMATSIGFDLFIRSTCGPLLYLMRENFDSIAQNYITEKENESSKPYKKFFVYSGHDTTIIPLLMAFEIFEMRWPNYASYILLKYYASKTNPSETYVAVDYAAQPQVLPNCDSYYCPYSTFINILKNRFEKPKFLRDKQSNL